MKYFRVQHFIWGDPDNFYQNDFTKAQAISQKLFKHYRTIKNLIKNFHTI